MWIVADRLAEYHSEVVALLLQLVDPPPLDFRFAQKTSVTVISADVSHDGDGLSQFNIT